MKRSELDALKAVAAERKDKATDMDVLIVALLEMPHGQLKKLLTAEVKEVLKKYGYMEE